MTTSTLIASLTAFQEKHGDVPVVIRTQSQAMVVLHATADGSDAPATPVRLPRQLILIAKDDLRDPVISQSDENECWITGTSAITTTTAAAVSHLWLETAVMDSQS